MGDTETGNYGRFAPPAWVRARLDALPPGNAWSQTAEARDLVEWLYLIATRRAELSGIGPGERAEVAQDAMPLIVQTINRRRERITRADNPAAFLERLAARAVAAAIHRYRMAGFGGVSANGRNWRVRYPWTVGGDLGLELLEAMPDSDCRSNDPVEDVVRRVVCWSEGHLGVCLTRPAVDAIQYAIDRLVTGVSRGALVRGRVALGRDPAMQHLGIGPADASAFGRWLLGRNDDGRKVPSVLDAVLSDRAPAVEERATWRACALEAGIAREIATDHRRTA